MKGKAKINQDTLRIPQGLYFEPYTPVAGQIISPGLVKHLKYAQICLSADASVTFKDVLGNQVTGFALNKGRHSFLVSEISSTGGIAVAIIHDGDLATGFEE